MKKLSTMSLAVIAALGLGLSGCGSSSSSATPDFFTALVSRGDVYSATVTDSAATPHVAVQVEGKNQYKFNVPESEIVFPIVVNGGYVDVNDDGEITEGVDTKLNIELKSYDATVTPVTTYLADETSQASRDAKLQVLVDTINSNSDTPDVTAADLLKPASDTTFDAAAAINAVYAELTDVKESGSSFDIGDVNGSYNTIREEVRARKGEAASNVDLEEYTIEDLNIPTLTSDDVAKYKEDLKSFFDNTLDVSTPVSVDDLNKVSDLQGKTVYTMDLSADPKTYTEIEIANNVTTDTKLDATTYELVDGQWQALPSSDVTVTATLDAQSDDLTLIINDGKKETKEVIDTVSGAGTELKSKVSFKDLNVDANADFNTNVNVDTDGFSADADGSIYLDMTAEMKDPSTIN